MDLLKRLFGKAKTQGGVRVRSNEREEKAAILNAAEGFVLGLWAERGGLVRQAVFWNADEEISMVAFTDASSREAALEQLKDSARERTPKRMYFFSESTAFAPDGRQIDVIALEVGDAQLDFYGQRIYSAEKEPKQLAEQTTRLSESPLAAMLVVGGRSAT